MDARKVKTSSGPSGHLPHQGKARRIRERRFTDADVVCPFYQWHTDKSVCCEWPTEWLRVRIEGRSNRVRDQMQRYCTTDEWKRCPWAEKLMELFED